MREIIVIDDVPPEANAMLQALYSRSPTSVKEHLVKVQEVGPGKFMANYYVGYGHKSIGDCGTTSVFIENISMLAAKAVQDWPLYSGQEASTRYLDMSKQEFMNPLESPGGALIQREWLRFYTHALEVLIPELKTRFPKKEEEKDTVYEKAIKARAFDIARGFLPAGATTYVAWHTNLRQAHDHLKEMRHHPLEEVRTVAREIVETLKQKYPSSFVHKEYPSEEEYLDKSEAAFAYGDDAVEDFYCESRLDLQGLEPYKHLLTERPAKAELHNRFRQFGDVLFRFPLDFGSYRDLQRQRSAVQDMPLLTTKHGFYDWYLDQLPSDLKNEAMDFLAEQEERIAKLHASDATKQYYVAMGYTVSVNMTCPLPSAVYIAELRSAQTVHPTLRVRAQQMGEALTASVPNLAMHHDMSPDEWNTKRGTQDIVKKGTAVVA